MGVERAGANAVVERAEAGGLMGNWTAFFEPEKGGLDLRKGVLAQAGMLTAEICLRQEQSRCFSMPPPPALLRWLLEQPRARVASEACLGSVDFEDAEGEDEEMLGAWDELSDEERAAVRLLGFTRRAWSAQPRKVSVAWDELIDDEVSAAETLGFTAASWNALLPAAPAAFEVSDAARHFAEQHVARAEAMEQKVREVRAHPLPNREEEPNNKSQDRDLRKLAEWIPPQQSEGTPWRECVRSRAWLWYSLEDA